MKFSSRLRGIGWLAALGLAAAAMAFPPEGKYREEIRNPLRGQNFSLVKTLHLRIGGQAELYFEYRGDKPVIDYSVVNAFGGLMEAVRDYRKLKHTGSWRMANGRILVELTRIESDGRQTNLLSNIDFELFGDELQARNQDRGDYGNQMMRLKLLERYDSEPTPSPSPIPAPIPGGGSDFDPGRRKGSYAWAEEVPAKDGASLLVRRLKLNGDRSAELVSEYLGDKPQLDGKMTGQFGALFAEVVSRRKISHRGAWREVDGKVRVELDRIGSGDFAQNVRSVFVLEPKGGDLAVREQDEGDYGTRGGSYRKDWSPSAPSKPGTPNLPDRPAPTPRPAKTTELDREGPGAGSLSHQGTSARKLDTLRLVLMKDGRYEIRVRGEGEAVFRGRYEMRGPRQFTLDCSDALGSGAAGAGTLELRENGTVRSLTLRGSAGNRRFTLTFQGHAGSPGS